MRAFLISRSVPFALLAAMGATALAPRAARGQMSDRELLAFLDDRRGEMTEVAMEIWDLAELGYVEHESSALLSERLAAAGFEVRTGVAGIPTAFVAERGTGGPVIGFLAEFDALPGLDQAAVPERSPIEGRDAGHACGHHLFGTASVDAAIATAEWLERTGSAGTVRLYGTPAEEGGSGKVYLVRAGLFDDVDVVLTWHPGDANDASPGSNLAVKSAKFRFQGVAAHAAAAPERGRSALDGVEAMNDMVNMLREHVPQETRLHYVITSGGRAPNVVPEHAEVYYYVRHPDPEVVRSIFERVVKAAEGAALGTETTVTHEVVGGSYSKLPVVALQEALHANLERVGGVEYDEADVRFARVLRGTLGEDVPPLESAARIQPFEWARTYASSDAGDVSWKAPMGSVRTATWVPGTAAHTWQAVAAGGTGIGAGGMMVAAKTLALTAVDLLSDPALLERVREEFAERRGDDFDYRPLLGDREPPLDYRVSGSR